MQMRRRRHDETDKEGWTSGGDLADVEETPRSRSDAHNVIFPTVSHPLSKSFIPVVWFRVYLLQTSGVRKSSKPRRRKA